MSESDEAQSARKPLPVINSADKVEQLRKEAAADSKPSRHVDTTIVSRFCDANKTAKQKAIEEKAIDAIRQVYDPEIPVNIYDLGLIYGIAVDDSSGKVKIRMTLTAPACPVAGQIVSEVQRRVEAIDEVPSAEVELVWEPPWSREMMSEAAQLELGLL